MKLVREHINEKFTEDSDPIKDMRIGLSKQITDWLSEMGITNYIINDNFTIDVKKSVDLNNKNLSNFPTYITFNIVGGSFSIQRNNFTTLRGCPREVGHLFSCSNNLLKSLRYAPKIAANFFCHHNLKEFTIEDILKVCDVTGGIKEIYVK
jgi:hypothetical protein